MVSTLLSSITDLLRGAPDPHVEQNAHVKKKFKRKSKEREKKPEVTEKNANKASATTAATAPTKRSKPSVKAISSNAGIEYLNAESLDRAIVHRLQSKVSFTTPNTKREQRKEEEERFTRRSSRKDTLTSKAAIPVAEVLPDSGVNSLTSEPKVLVGRILLPEIHASGSRLDDSLNTDMMALRAAEANNFRSYVEHYNSATAPPLKSPQSENRGIVYKNTQFNMDNASREALIPEVQIQNHDFNLGESIMNQPIFGIPNPSVHRPLKTSPSTESLRINLNMTATESVLGNSPDSSARSRSASPKTATLRSPFYTSTLTGSSSELGEQLFDTTMNDIIEKGGDEFKSKYSSWVWEAFRSHLVQLKSVLLAEFNHKMRSTLNEREQEVMSLQQQYREKLSEFDVTTEGFQKMIDNLYQENQRVLKAKDSIIEKLKKEFMECKRHFEQDLIRQMQTYRKEAEVEKLELQKRNDELMMVMLTDASKSGLEEAFKREIESLHKMIKALTTQNDVLHQQLEESKNSASILNKKTIDGAQMQLEQAGKEITELRKRLQVAEREKEDLTVVHHEQIAKLNRKIQESSTRYDHQLRDTAEEMENLRRKYQRETKDLKTMINNQEANQMQMLNQVKQQYGSQVETLSKAVAQLQNELTLRGGNKRYLQTP